MLSTPRLPLRILPLFLLVSCASMEERRAESIAEFLEEHYGSLTVGADWEAVRSDFSAEAVVARMDPDHPGAVIPTPVDEFFASVGPSIDSLRFFHIEPKTLWITLYDRLATAWVHAVVEQEDAEGQAKGFEGVDQFSLIQDEDGRWRIIHLVWQEVAEEWEPPRASRTWLFARSAPAELRVGISAASY